MGITDNFTKRMICPSCGKNIYNMEKHLAWSQIAGGKCHLGLVKNYTEGRE